MSVMKTTCILHGYVHNIHGNIHGNNVQNRPDISRTLNGFPLAVQRSQYKPDFTKVKSTTSAESEKCFKSQSAAWQRHTVRVMSGIKQGR